MSSRVGLNRSWRVCFRPALAAALALLFISLPLAAEETWTPKHLAKLRSVVSAKVSPDGKSVAYLLAIPRELMKEDSGSSWVELHVLKEGREIPFITGKVSISSIRWTPDGQSISFLNKKDGDKARSLYLIPVNGGESRKAFDSKLSVSSYVWSPDGKRVAFLSSSELKEDKEKKKFKDKGFAPIIYEEEWKPSRVWLVDVNADGSGEPKALELPGSASSLSWSPDGSRLLVALAPTSLVDDYYMNRRLRVISVEGGKVETEIANPGKLGDTAWSPDGKHIAFITAEDPNDPSAGRIWVVPAKGGKPVDVLPNFLGEVSALGWLDNSRIIYVGDVSTVTEISEVGRDGKNRKTLLKPGKEIWKGLSIASTPADHSIVTIGNSATHPGEAFHWTVGKGKPERKTDSNPWLKDMRFAKQEIVRHKARDGLELEGILIRPLDEKKGQRYPLILTVHGGPEAHMQNGWLSRYSYAGQVGAARGFAVFYPNYRGSTGRGVKFSKLSQADAAGKEFDDFVDAVDHLIEIGLVDKAKVGITGGSYGGYASAWGATYYSHRFAASVMFVGISDNISKVGTTDIPYEMFMVHHLKWLWDDWKYFLERSPIYHIKKGKTPTLILHGKDDPRVHPGQSMELFRHLKTLGKVPVRLVFYPGEGHGNRKSAARYDYNLRLLRWMEHYLKGPGGKAPDKDLDYDIEEEEPKERVSGESKSEEPVG